MQRTLIDERYAIVAPLGSGGMGEVYLARDELLGRDVALKVLKEEYASSEEFKARFRREAENAASLSHPNIVSVYDRGEDGPDGTPYMAMEHVPGGTLGERIARYGPLGPFEAARIACQVALALAEAHRRGVVHRDIKPHNVFLTGDPFEGVGAVKVGDFGIARAARATAITETDFILGSVRYVSPEQAMGEPVGPKSDLYSLGVVLYEMLTGKVPFNGDGPIATAIKHIWEFPPSPKRANPDVPEDLEAVTLKLLSKDSALRYPDALTLAEDLERVARGLRPKARASSPSGSWAVRDAFFGGGRPRERGTSSTTRKRRRHLGRRLSAAVVSVLLIFAAAASLYEIPWLAEVPKLSEEIAARSGEAQAPNAPEEDAGEVPSEQPAQKETEAGADAATGNPVPLIESPMTGAPPTPEPQSAVEPVSYVALQDLPVEGAKEEPALYEPTHPEQGGREKSKDPTETTSSPSRKSSSGAPHPKEAREEQEKQAEEAREKRAERVEGTPKQQGDRTTEKPKAVPQKTSRPRGR